MSIDRGMDKDVHTYNGIVFSHKNEWNNAICSNMDGPQNYHTNKHCQRVEDKHHHMLPLYMWHLNKGYKWIFLQNRETSRLWKTRLPKGTEEVGGRLWKTLGYQRGQRRWVGADGLVFGTGVCTPTYLANRDLL